MEDRKKRKRMMKNLIFWLLLILCTISFGVRHDWGELHVPFITILFFIFPSLGRSSREREEFTDFVLEHRFGRHYEVVRWLGFGVLMAGFFFSCFYPNVDLGMRVFLWSLVFFFLHEIWLLLVIVDQKAIWREKWNNEEK